MKTQEKYHSREVYTDTWWSPDSFALPSASPTAIHSFSPSIHTARETESSTGPHYLPLHRWKPHLCLTAQSRRSAHSLIFSGQMTSQSQAEGAVARIWKTSYKSRPTGRVSELQVVIVAEGIGMESILTPSLGVSSFVTLHHPMLSFLWPPLWLQLLNTITNPWKKKSIVDPGIRLNRHCRSQDTTSRSASLFRRGLSDWSLTICL